MEKFSELNKAGANFKFIPGCEMYVHPDLEAWNLDYEISKAAKKGDTAALHILRAQREKLVTPITMKVDGDDEPIDISTDSASLTIENEEETKSGKFYDPVKRRHHLVVLPKTLQVTVEIITYNIKNTTLKTIIEICILTNPNLLRFCSSESGDYLCSRSHFCLKPAYPGLNDLRHNGL